MNADLSDVRKKTVEAGQYISSLDQPFRQNFLIAEQTYQMNSRAINQLKKFAGSFVVVAFSAGWCKDCAKNIPVLALIGKATGLEIRVFGGLKKDPLSHVRKWRIPPSPSEVETFSVEKIPLIIVFDDGGVEIGRIIENPKQWPTIEEELLAVIKSQR
jgi:thiol-disulfide isomerase/thioredoxin